MASRRAFDGALPRQARLGGVDARLQARAATRARDRQLGLEQRVVLLQRIVCLRLRFGVVGERAAEDQPAERLDSIVDRRGPVLVDLGDDRALAGCQDAADVV